METTKLKCQNCGGDLEFSPEGQNYACPYCCSEFTQEEIDRANKISEEKTSSDAKEKEIADFAEHTNVYTCTSCGAEVISDENTAATFCAYCGSSIALSGRISDELCPDYIIPFKYTKEKAMEMYKNWCRKKWFVPNDFKSDQQIEKITGLYVPYWLSDCYLNAKITATSQIIKHRGDYQIIKEDESVRAAYIQYNKIPADASLKLNDALMDSIEPFNFSELIPFNRSYLQGFYADRFDVAKEDVLARIKTRAENGATDLLKGKIQNFDVVNVKHTYSNVIKTDWHYALFPIWIMNYKQGDKKYEFMMNGQTGKFVGALPISPLKLGIFATVVASLVGIASTFFDFFN